MMPAAIQKPRAEWISGSASKFMPKKPVMRFRGMKMAVSTVSVRMMLFVRCPSAENASAPPTRPTTQSPHVGQHALHMLQHIAGAHAQQLTLTDGFGVAVVGPVAQGVDPFLHGASLVLSQTSSSRCRVAAFQQQRPVIELAVRVEQGALQRGELARQQAAQLR